MAAIQNEFDYLVKLVVVGESGTGKSSLLKRFADNEYHSNYISTIGVDFAIRTIDLNERKVKLQIWDTAGQERFANITTSYYRGAHGILLCVDVTDADTLRTIPKWLREIELHAVEGTPVVLVATKCDAPLTVPPLHATTTASLAAAAAYRSRRVVDAGQLAAISKEYGMRVVETSAKDSLNVESAFAAIACEAISNIHSKIGGLTATAKGAAKGDGVDLSDTPSTLRCCVIL